jgi:Cu-processing system permease protein
MFPRIAAIALNTYREAIRARILYGLMAAAFATLGYAVFLGATSLHQDTRVIANVGSASASFFSVVVAVVVGATSLHREIELKTIFPILTRKLRRHEYVLGKFFGLLLTVTVFLCLDGSLLFSMLAGQSGRPVSQIGAFWAVSLLALAFAMWKAKHRRIFVMIPWSLVALTVTHALAEPSGAERRLVLASLVLALGEVAIVSAIALLFSAFSSPFLTAIFSLAAFLIGRSADTLAHIPARYFGEQAKVFGQALAKVVPNLQLFVPPRPLLLGEVDGMPVWPYVLQAWSIAGLYVALFLTVSCLIFRTRDFT